MLITAPLWVSPSTHGREGAFRAGKPLDRGFFCYLYVLHGQSVAPVAAAQRITRIAPPGHAERKPLAIPPQHFSSSIKRSRSRLSRVFLSGCYGSLSTIDGLHHTAAQSELFVQGGKLNHGFLTSEDVTAADTIDRDIIWSCNRLRQSKKQPESATTSVAAYNAQRAGATRCRGITVLRVLDVVAPIWYHIPAAAVKWYLKKENKMCLSGGRSRSSAATLPATVATLRCASYPQVTRK